MDEFQLKILIKLEETCAILFKRYWILQYMLMLKLHLYSPTEI